MMRLPNWIRGALGLVAVTSVATVMSLELAWGPSLMLVALVLLPLAFLLPGLWRGRLGAYRMSTVVSVFYAGFALTEIVARPEIRWLPGLLLLAATALIGLCILAIRQTPPAPSPAAPDE